MSHIAPVSPTIIVFQIIPNLFKPILIFVTEKRSMIAEFIIFCWHKYLKSLNFENQTTLFYTGNDGGGVVIRQNHVSGLFWDIGPSDNYGNTYWFNDTNCILKNRTEN